MGHRGGFFPFVVLGPLQDYPVPKREHFFFLGYLGSQKDKGVSWQSAGVSFCHEPLHVLKEML